MKIVTVVGARPQFIKAATLSRVIAEHQDIQECIIHTGQHFDANMSDLFFEQMQIPKPDYHLDIHGLGHGAMTGQMLEGIEAILLKEKPDCMLVYGDTNSTLAGALAAKKLHIKVAHVEAGLRSFNMKMPEEVNRIVTDRVSDILFCPTDIAVDNLKNEGYDHFDCKIIKSGDVMQDGAMFYKNLSRKPLCTIDAHYVLSTIHRAENTDNIERLTSIIEALNEINRDKQVILPLHPRTKKMIEEHKLQINFTLIEPVGYLEMVWLIEHCDMVMTDSGGLQKEAFFFKKPCITLRDETEWIELIDNGFNTLSGAEKEKILDYYMNYKFNNSFDINLYGNGKASFNILQELL